MGKIESAPYTVFDIPNWASKTALLSKIDGLIVHSDEDRNREAQNFLRRQLDYAFYVGSQDNVDALADLCLSVLQDLDKQKHPDKIQCLAWMAGERSNSFDLWCYGKWHAPDSSNKSNWRFRHLRRVLEPQLFKALSHRGFDDFLNGDLSAYEDFEEFDGAELSDWFDDLIAVAQFQMCLNIGEAVNIALGAFTSANASLMYPLPISIGIYSDECSEIGFFLVDEKQA